MNWFHESFWVRNRSIPAPRRIWGSWPPWPNDVRAPELAAAPSEAALEEALAVEELADDRLAGGQVAVRLDPGAADDEPAPLGDPPGDPGVEVGGVLLQPQVVLGGRGGEPVLRVAVEEVELVGGDPDHLAAGLGERPEPGGVEVGVTEGGDAVDVAPVPLAEEVRQDGPGRRPGRPVAGVPGVAEPVELTQQPSRPGRVEPPRVLGLQGPQDLEVPGEVPRVLVDQGEPAPFEARVRVGSGERVVDPWRLPPGPADPPARLAERVGEDVGRRHLAHPARARHLHLELDALACGGGRRDDGRRAACAPAGVQALHGRAVAPERGLAAAVPEEVDPAPGPRVRKDGGDAEPVRRPERPEGLPDRRRPIAQLPGGRPAVPAGRRRDEERVGSDRLRVDEGVEAARGLRQPPARLLGMPAHALTRRAAGAPRSRRASRRGGPASAPGRAARPASDRGGRHGARPVGPPTGLP